jgi:S1-C subfamily serine protease
MQLPVNVLTCVEPGGPMQKSGFEPGMLVTTFDDQQISSVSDIDNLVKAHSPGDSILVNYVDVPNSAPMQPMIKSKWVTMGSRP